MQDFSLMTLDSPERKRCFPAGLVFVRSPAETCFSVRKENFAFHALRDIHKDRILLYNYTNLVNEHIQLYLV